MDMLGQVTDGLNMEVDPDLFASAVSYIDDTGARVHPTLSTLTPRPGSKDNERQRRVARNKFKLWRQRVDKFYPASLFKSSTKKDKTGSTQTKKGTRITKQSGLKRK